MRFRKLSLLIIITMCILIVPYTVFAKAEEVDVILFFGQSNMVGYAGNYDTEKVKDARFDSLGIDSFSDKTGIDKSILSNYSKMSHVDVDIDSGSAYEYVYSSNSLKELSSNTETLGEKLYWDTSTNKLVTSGSSNPMERSRGTNMIPQFVKSYYDKTGRKVIAVMAAKGGQEIANFLPHNEVLQYSKSNDSGKNNYIYEGMIEYYNAAIDYLNNHSDQYKIGKKFYVVFQGEKDAEYISNGSMSSQDYYDLFMKVHNHLKSDLGLEYGGLVESVYTPGEGSKYAGVVGINNAQKQLVNNNNDIFLASSYAMDHYVPDQSNYSGSNYNEALENSRLSVCITSNINDIHYTAAALSQIGKDSALASVKELNKRVDWLTSLVVNDSELPVDEEDFILLTSNDTDRIRIDATTYHEGLTFVNGYGPREEDLEEGENNFVLKVTDGSTVKDYSFTVYRSLPPQPDDPTPDDPTPDDPTPDDPTPTEPSNTTGNSEKDDIILPDNVTVGDDAIVIGPLKDKDAQVVKVENTAASNSAVTYIISFIIITVGGTICVRTIKKRV